MTQVKTGIGLDVHQLAAGHELVIGGVIIPAPFGSVGHSDGDALVHAIVDAILGAAALGDIGKYFPSDDDRWKGMSSLRFLIDATERVRETGFEIEHIDSVIVLQSPKLADFIPQIRYKIAYTMQIEESAVSVKATTTDHLGFVGTGNGWAVQAIATLSK